MYKEVKLSKEDYNREPVFYCRKCLSLSIKGLEEGVDYCERCGSTDIEVASITYWQELVKKKNS